jgi:phospholipid/cholesterol/gamma-HCH transport system permease protein
VSGTLSSAGPSFLDGLRRWLARQGRMARFAGLTLAAAVTPRAYDPVARAAVAQALCVGAWQPLPGYFLASLLLGGVLTRVFSVTAASYGLSHLALEAMIRVYIMELLPLAAALFVALRAIPALPAAELPDARRAPTIEVVAHFVGSLLSVWVLAVASSLASLVVAYLVMHGATLWALEGYGRIVGQVFSPLAAAALALKLFLFSLAVALAPLSLFSDLRRRSESGAELRAVARLLLFLVIVEGAALALRVS